jgi:hypothetical protein
LPRWAIGYLHTMTVTAHTGEQVPALRWPDIPGWFRWRDGQEEAVAHFPDGSRFVEVGNYLGKSLCSMAELVVGDGRQISIVGVDTCRGSGPEGTAEVDAHGAVVDEGGGTFAGQLHRNVLNCGYGDNIQLIIGDSLAGAALFADASLDWVHIDARHDYDSVLADIAAWLPKVVDGGWISGDDYDAVQWPGVFTAVADSLPDAQPWSDCQWRWVKPS